MVLGVKVLCAVAKVQICKDRNNHLILKTLSFFTLYLYIIIFTEIFDDVLYEIMHKTN